MSRIPDWLAQVLADPVTDIPTAGRALKLSRNGSYDAARRGDIPTIPIGKLRKVPTAWLAKTLQIDNPAQ